MGFPKMRGESFSLKPFLDWLPLEDCSVLEVGCFAGEGTVEFLACDKVRSVTCVDPFKGGYDDGDAASGAEMGEAAARWARWVQACRGEKPVQLICGGPWDHCCADLIYIDADHRYGAVKRDLADAVRMGASVVAGHDYGVAQHAGVKRAVDEAFPDKVIHTFPDYSWAVVL